MTTRLVNIELEEAREVSNRSHSEAAKAANKLALSIALKLNLDCFDHEVMLAVSNIANDIQRALETKGTDYEESPIYYAAASLVRQVEEAVRDDAKEREVYERVVQGRVGEAA